MLCNTNCIDFLQNAAASSLSLSAMPIVQNQLIRPYFFPPSIMFMNTYHSSLLSNELLQFVGHNDQAPGASGAAAVSSCSFSLFFLSYCTLSLYSLTLHFITVLPLILHFTALHFAYNMYTISCENIVQKSFSQYVVSAVLLIIFNNFFETEKIFVPFYLRKIICFTNLSYSMLTLIIM